MTTLARRSILCLVPLVALVPGCSGAGDDAPTCTGAKCDDLDRPDGEVAATPCDGILHDRSGRGHEKVAGRLNDPVAAKVFRVGDDCPTSFADIMAKLRINDAEGCSGETAGIATRVVSETAQATGAPTSYRLVTTRECEGRPTHGVLFSLFGVAADATELPTNVEIMAFDATAGVFNYYEADGAGIHFFGNSKDMLGGKGAGDDRRCAGCHTGGGMIMKELDTPWLHWEGHMDTPGAAELVERFPDLGAKRTGNEFEGVTKDGNEAWNASRIELLKQVGTPQDLLRPLFCSVEVNLDTGADFSSPITGEAGGLQVINNLPVDSMIDPHLKRTFSIPIEFEDYHAAIVANGQRVEGVAGAVDTVFDYVFVERSHADMDYVDQLRRLGIVDDELVQDVLLVDFTRPVFSDDRCALLDAVPAIPTADLTPTGIRDGMIASLAGAAAGTPAGDLRANLEATGGHRERVGAFLAACTATDKQTMVENALRITSLNRRNARALQVFEFPQTMPIDDLDVAAGSRLHPTTCAITTDYVPIAP